MQEQTTNVNQPVMQQQPSASAGPEFAIAPGFEGPEMSDLTDLLHTAVAKGVDRATKKQLEELQSR